MSVLLVSEVFPPQTGGSGRWFWEIYRRLPRQHTLIAAGQHPDAARFDATHDLRIERVPLALATWGMLSRTGLRSYWKAYRQLCKLIQHAEVTQIHCGKALPEGWLAWLIHKRYGLPFLCYVHGEELNVSASSRELSWMTARILRSAQRVIVNSHNTRQLVQQMVALPPAKVQVLHPGVDVQRFVPAPRDPAVRAKLGWEDRRVVLTVGRLQVRKGHDRLIEALPQIRAVVPDVLYAIVGDGGERSRLETLAERHGVADCVQFRGDVPDAEMIECYQQCDLFVLPNREVEGDTEGFGMVLLEAQACGKPVVAGASGGTAETMQVPTTGRLVDCRTSGPIAGVVSELLQDAKLRQQMGRAGRRWTEEQFSWESLSRQAEQIFAASDPSKAFTVTNSTRRVAG